MSASMIDDSFSTAPAIANRQDNIAATIIIGAGEIIALFANNPTTTDIAKSIKAIV